MTLRTATQALAAPAYMWDLATTAPITAANFAHMKMDGGLIEFVNSQFSRQRHLGRCALDARNMGRKVRGQGHFHPGRCAPRVAIGADAVWVSNHGGRQLDTAPASIDTLPAIADAVRGDAEIIFDGGVRRGTDIIKALALGANAIAIGRAYLYGLAAGGEARRGPRAVMERTEARDGLLGRTRISALTRDIIFQRSLR